MILMELSSTITKKLFILKELGVFWGRVFWGCFGGVRKLGAYREGAVGCWWENEYVGVETGARERKFISRLV